MAMVSRKSFAKEIEKIYFVKLPQDRLCIHHICNKLSNVANKYLVEGYVLAQKLSGLKTEACNKVVDIHFIISLFLYNYLQTVL